MVTKQGFRSDKVTNYLFHSYAYNEYNNTRSDFVWQLKPFKEKGINSIKGGLNKII